MKQLEHTEMEGKLLHMPVFKSTYFISERVKPYVSGQKIQKALEKESLEIVKALLRCP